MYFFEFLTSAIEILGTIAFALSGTLVGIDKGLDFFGVMVLGAITAVGGGITRDIILGRTPPAAFLDPKFILISVLLSLIVILLFNKFSHLLTPSKMSKLMLTMNILDALGLALFTVTGINITISMGFENNPFLYIFIGVITGVGGGLLRDIFVHKTPMIFTKNIYATAAIIGGLCFWGASKFFTRSSALIIGAAVIVIIRFLSIRHDFNLPKFNNKDYFFE